MKKLMIPFMAIIIAIGLNAFTTKKPTGTFYQYTSSSHLEADITNIANYAAETESCAGGSNVCGVTLATNEGTGNEPKSSEFSAESANLWSSQDNGSAADPNIAMKD